MRIGINGRLFYQFPMEGIARYTYHHTYEMALAHPYDSFYVYLDRKSKHQLDFPKNVKIILIPFPTRHPKLIEVYFNYILPLFFRLHRIDVFYSGDYYLSLYTKIPQIMVIHDLAYIHYPQHLPRHILDYYKKAMPKWIRKAAAIITVSNYVKADVSKQFNVSIDAVSGNAVSTENITTTQVNLPSARPFFVYIGSIHPRKNIENMVNGFLQFNAQHRSDYQLIIAGRIAWKSNTLYQIFDKEKSVHYIGEVTEEEKWDLLIRSKAVVYLSLFEGFGIPILEAFAAKTLVITSNTTSMPEVGQTAALYADPQSVEEIALAFNQAATLHNRTQRILAGTHRLDDFTWQNEAAKTYKVIQDVFQKQSH
ncbi:MAG: glycosyltransferase family 1 protein [Saprospiraceae bacterium]